MSNKFLICLAEVISVTARAVARVLIGGGGVCEYSYFLVMRLISKDISRT